MAELEKKRFEKFPTKLVFLFFFFSPTNDFSIEYILVCLEIYFWQYTFGSVKYGLDIEVCTLSSGCIRWSSGGNRFSHLYIMLFLYFFVILNRKVIQHKQRSLYIYKTIFLISFDDNYTSLFI